MECVNCERILPEGETICVPCNSLFEASPTVSSPGAQSGRGNVSRSDQAASEYRRAIEAILVANEHLRSVFVTNPQRSEHDLAHPGSIGITSHRIIFVGRTSSRDYGDSKYTRSFPFSMLHGIDVEHKERKTRGGIEVTFQLTIRYAPNAYSYLEFDDVKIGEQAHGHIVFYMIESRKTTA